MYACKQCGTGNPLDSSFCKKCGTALPEADLAEARVKLNEMLEEGNNLFTDGRTEEAMLIAEAAVAANPSSHLAQSLKGLCHERVGQIAEALECYETAVSLNPDSSLDKVKVAALRNRLAQRVADVPAPSRQSAAVMAGAAMVVVLVLGCFVAIGMSSRHEPPKIVANPPATQQPLAASDLVENQTPNAPTVPQQTPSNTAPPAYTPPTQLFGGGQIPGLQPGDINTLPAPTTGGGGYTIDPGSNNKPVNPPGPTPPGPTERQGDTVDTPVKPEAGNTPTQPVEDPGYVHVEVSHGYKPGIPHGGQDVDDGHEAATVLKAAQLAYQLGHYDQAASKYAKLAEMGENSGRVQQRLGDCYRNLTKADQARGAYNRAISLYQSQIKQGHDVAGNQRGLDTCESALKVLGG